MPDAIRATYEKDGQVLKNIQGVNISEAGGGASVALRGITPDGKPFGWADGQVPNYQITFNVVVVDDQEVDWHTLSRTKAEFVFAEATSAYDRTFDRCKCQSCESSTDESGNPAWAVTIEALTDTYTRT